jgi:hypothetical protein
MVTGIHWVLGTSEFQSYSEHDDIQKIYMCLFVFVLGSIGAFYDTVGYELREILRFIISKIVNIGHMTQI